MFVRRQIKNRSVKKRLDFTMDLVGGEFAIKRRPGSEIDPDNAVAKRDDKAICAGENAPPRCASVVPSSEQ